MRTPSGVRVTCSCGYLPLEKMAPRISREVADVDEPVVRNADVDSRLRVVDHDVRRRAGGDRRDAFAAVKST